MIISFTYHYYHYIIIIITIIIVIVQCLKYFRNNYLRFSKNRNTVRCFTFCIFFFFPVKIKSTNLNHKNNSHRLLHSHFCFWFCFVSSSIISSVCLSICVSWPRSCNCLSNAKKNEKKKKTRRKTNI